jgi:glycine dehydrogenase subunit 2
LKKLTIFHKRLRDTEMKKTPLIFTQGRPGRLGVDLPSGNLSDEEFEKALPERYRRKELRGFPEVSEPEVIRHYTRLSQKNFCIDGEMYPLGSCTMKHNPRAHEEIARLSGFANLHPETPVRMAQGALRILWELEQLLCEICGMDAFTLAPVAGAHGELTGMKVIRAALHLRGEKRNKVIIPFSAHGTNPASAALCGYAAAEIGAGTEGILEPAALEKLVDENTAALMLTNPNTLGLFERRIGEMAEILHRRGAYLYCDGANLNAIVGVARPGDMGIDVIQTNMHKTFTTPHGGGGPGAGPVGVKKELARFLPVPRVLKEEDHFALLHSSPDSIGRIHSFFGNFLVLLRAYAYIRAMGARGLRAVSEMAVLNANYLRVLLLEDYFMPFSGQCMHECLFTDQGIGAETKDIAKRLIDSGFHPPTVYFPKCVENALLIEPTETESKETLDEFAAAMKEIAREAKDRPEILREAPHNTPVRRMDETLAGRQANKCLNLRWKPKTE